MIDVEVVEQFVVVVDDSDLAVAAAVSDGGNGAAVAKDDFVSSGVCKKMISHCE